MCSGSLLLKVNCHIKNGATSEVFPMNNKIVPSMKRYYLSSTYIRSKRFQFKVIRLKTHIKSHKTINSGLFP